MFACPPNIVPSPLDLLLYRPVRQTLGDRVGMRCLLFGLEVIEEDGTFLGLLTPVADDDAGAVDDLPGVTFAVEYTCRKGVMSVNSIR